MCSKPLIPKNWNLPSAQRASHSHRDEVYTVCNQPLIPERLHLTSVQPALHLFREITFFQCATSPSSLLRDDVHPVCSGPLLSNSAWEMRFTQCAVGLSSLRDEVYIVHTEPLIPNRWSLPSIKRAPHSLGDHVNGDLVKLRLISVYRC